MSIKALAKKGLMMAKVNSPEILAGLAMVGTVVTAVLAVRAGMRASEILVETRSDRDVMDQEPLTRVQEAKLVAKEFIPTVIAGVATVGCIVGSHKASVRKYLALAAVSELNEQKLKELQEKLPEFLGPKKTEELMAEVNRPPIEDMEDVDKIIIDTGKGNTIFYDSISGRYFKSNIERVRRAQNDINEQIIGDWSATLNDFYCCCGLDSTKLGDDLGWNTNNMLRVLFTSSLLSNGTPIVVMDYEVYPEYRLL